DAMAAAQRASLLGMRAAVGVTYPVVNKLSLRGDLGIGIAMLRGLVEGNPFTESHHPGWFTMFSVRLGVAVEYAITPNVIATIAPLGLAFSPAPDGLVFRSITQLDVLAGVGYRM